MNAEIMSTTRQNGSTIRWSTNVRLVGWLPMIGSAVAIIMALILSIIAWWTEGISPAYPRSVTFIVPLAVALQSAFLLSPSEEPSLEILLASPRSLPMILQERLLVVAILHGGIALAGSLISLVLPNTANLLGTVIGWLVPSICLCGISLWVTQLTRQSAFSALLIMVLWGGMCLGGDAMVARWPVLWPLNLFLQLDRVFLFQYVMNRVLLVLVGLATMIRAFQYMCDEEHMLGVQSVTERRRR